MWCSLLFHPNLSCDFQLFTMPLFFACFVCLIVCCLFVYFTWWQSVCFETGEEKYIHDLFCNSVECKYKLLPSCTFIFIGCVKFNVSQIIAVRATENNLHPKKVWKVERQELADNTQGFPLGNTLYHLLLLKLSQTRKSCFSNIIISSRFCFHCMKKLC